MRGWRFGQADLLGRHTGPESPDGLHLAVRRIRLRAGRPARPSEYAWPRLKPAPPHHPLYLLLFCRSCRRHGRRLGLWRQALQFTPSVGGNSVGSRRYRSARLPPRSTAQNSRWISRITRLLASMNGLSCRGNCPVVDHHDALRRPRRIAGGVARPGAHLTVGVADIDLGTGGIATGQGNDPDVGVRRLRLGRRDRGLLSTGPRGT